MSIERSLKKSGNKSRAEPGSTGKGKFYHVNIRNKSDFVIFRNHDVGERGNIERLAGKRANGRWATVSWLIDKNEAHIERGFLVGDNEDVKKVLKKLRRKPRHFKGDIFVASPEINVPEKVKPTLAMKRTQKKNTKRAQSVRWEK